MNEMSKQELKNIYGGTTISGTLINSLVKGIDVILDLGRSLGSAIRRIQDKNVCPYEK